MKVKATTLPMESLLAAREESHDWFDAYTVEVDDPDGTLSPWSVIDGLIDVTPCWVLALFALRNVAVRCFGLRGVWTSLDGLRKRVRDLRDDPPRDFPFDVGIAGGKIDGITPREIVAGVDDRHLAFRGSVLVEPAASPGKVTVTLSTIVRFRNRFGRLYFLPVKPFHKFIVRSMLARLAAKQRRDV